MVNRPPLVDTFESYIPATTEVDMSGKRYTDEFKSEGAGRLWTSAESSRRQAVDSGAESSGSAVRGGEPEHALGDGITCLRKHEGWLYLAVVIDLFSRQVVGWSMRPTLHSDVVMQALLAAVWRRKPPSGLMLHSNQGCQFTGDQ